MNELLFFITIIICFSITIGFYKYLGKTGLLIWVAIATIISNIETVKIVEIFRIETALGTTLYASTFLTTDILNEKYGKKYSLKALKVGFLTMIITTLMMSLSLAFVPSQADFASDSLKVLFTLNLRITIASILGFVVSQFLDTNIYSWLKSKNNNLWLRNNVSTMISQLFDTIIFVFVAYAGMLDFKTILGIIFSMYIFKFVIAIFDTPFMYIAKQIKKVEEV